MSAIIPDDFFENLPSDSYEAGRAMVSKISSAISSNSFVKYKYTDAIEAFELCCSFLEHQGLAFPELHFDTNEELNRRYLSHWLDSLYETFTAEIVRKDTNFARERGRERFAILSRQIFCYQFSENDITKIQAHLNELWALISTSDELEEAHRKRLLNRLEQLQEELKKKLSDLDRFWGLIGDAGTVMKQFGETTEKGLKILATITAIAKIIFATQNGAHGLPPSGSHPLLNDLVPKLSQPISPENKPAERTPIDI